MLFMVRSLSIALNSAQWLCFAFLVSGFVFTIYFVEANSFSNDIALYQHKRNSFLESTRKSKRDNVIPIELIPTNLVLVSTMDGSIRGIDRFQGSVHWTLKGGPGSSIIKSNSKFVTHKLYKPVTDQFESKENNDGSFMDTIDDVFEKGQVEEPFVGFELQQSDWSSQRQPIEKKMEESDTYYIIEPQDGGTLYLYSDGRPLEKLPFSIEKIVNESPFRLEETIYIGRKSTLMIEIDPRNGKILQQIDINKVDDEYRMATKSKNPARTIFLGRNEYKVAVYDKYYNKIWNVTYSEYIPNKFDFDVPASNVPSDIYIAPDATHAITGVDVEKGAPIWSLDLPHPVVSVFDVFRRKDSTLAITKQDPPKSLNKGVIAHMLNMVNPYHRVSTAYVGVYNGSLYALSTEKYPLVRMSSWSSMYTGRRPGDTNIMIEGPSGTANQENNTSGTDWNPQPHEMCCNGCEYHTDCLIGQHRVQATLEEDSDDESIISDDSDHQLVLRPSEYLLPSPSTSLQLGPSPTLVKPPPEFYQNDEAYIPYKPPKTGFFHDGLGKFWKFYSLVCLVFIYLYRDRLQTFYDNHVILRWKKMMKKRAKAKKAKAKVAAAVKAEKSQSQKENLASSEQPELDQSKFKIGKPQDTKEQEILAPPTEAPDDLDQEPNRALDQEDKKTSSSSYHSLASIVKKSSTGLDLERFEQSKSRVLEISDDVLGYGSHGTVVYKGMFDNRHVAVKRLLLDFYDVALKEVRLLQESDDHPNVVRYFYKEETDRFLYIALELCFGSLNDYMERSLPLPEMQLCDGIDPANILLQITCGIQHLHSLKIVHRDIKPQNILLAPSKNRFLKDGQQVRVLISDFGLCKKLDGEQSSFNYTAASPAGTSGWRAPELLAGALAATPSDSSFSSTQDTSDPNMMGRVKATRAIDIFSAGCVFYYVLSKGDHPYGNRFGRENNILLGNYNLDKLDSMGEDGVEAKDLVEKMISMDPKSRPSADAISLHPFFWSTTKRLGFLQDASDRFEVEVRDPPSPLLQKLETNVATVIGRDWYKRIDRIVANDLGKFRKYDGRKIRDLLRALRNKKHHWQDLPDPVKKVYGEPPNQFLYYFTARFPHLLLHTYYVVANEPSLRMEGSLGQYFI